MSRSIPRMVFESQSAFLSRNVSSNKLFSLAPFKDQCSAGVRNSIRLLFLNLILPIHNRVSQFISIKNRLCNWLVFVLRPWRDDTIFNALYFCLSNTLIPHNHTWFWKDMNKNFIHTKSNTGKSEFGLKTALHGGFDFLRKVSKILDKAGSLSYITFAIESRKYFYLNKPLITISKMVTWDFCTRIFLLW